MTSPELVLCFPPLDQVSLHACECEFKYRSLYLEMSKFLVEINKRRFLVEIEKEKKPLKSELLIFDYHFIPSYHIIHIIISYYGNSII